MSQLQWQALSSEALSDWLAQGELLASSAVGAATVYHLQSTGASSTEQIAIALPDGQVIVVGLAPTDAPRRRRIEQTG
jgi:hypothetical protein